MAQADPYGDELKGIGGWLIWPLGGLIVNAVILFGALIAVLKNVKALPQMAVAIIVVGGFLLYIGYCLVRFLQQRREVPLLMTILYGMSAVYQIVFWIAYAGGYAWAIARPVHLYPFTNLLQLAFCLAWVAYFQTSVRVKNTFVGGPPPRKEPAGIGGWLLAPIALISTIAGIGIVAFVKTNVVQRFFQATTQGHVLPILRISASMVFLIFLLFCLVSVFRKKRYTPWLMHAAFTVLILLAGSGLFLPKSDHHNLPGAAALGLLSLTASIYVGLSKRVKNTFVR